MALDHDAVRVGKLPAGCPQMGFFVGDNLVVTAAAGGEGIQVRLTPDEALAVAWALLLQLAELRLLEQPLGTC